jgi:hypothetical protein
MQKHFATVLLCSIITSLFGCTRVVYNRYTHKQLLQSLNTKSDVTKQFGKPGKKIIYDKLEEWTYNLDTISTIGVINNPDSINVLKQSKKPDAVSASQPIIYHKYVKFIFDSAGNVQGYKSQNVDLATTKKEHTPTGTGKVLSVFGAVILIVILEFANAKLNDL